MATSLFSGFRRDVNEICDLLGYTQRRMVILYRRFETTYRSHLQGSRSQRRKGPLKTGPILCPEMLVKDYVSNLRNTTEERRSQVRCLFRADVHRTSEEQPLEKRPSDRLLPLTRISRNAFCENGLQCYGCNGTRPFPCPPNLPLLFIFHPPFLFFLPLFLPSMVISFPLF